MTDRERNHRAEGRKLATRYSAEIVSAVNHAYDSDIETLRCQAPGALKLFTSLGFNVPEAPWKIDCGEAIALLDYMGEMGGNIFLQELADEVEKSKSSGNLSK